MTEKEWLERDDLAAMSRLARGNACTCCGRLRPVDDVTVDGQIWCLQCPTDPGRAISDDQMWNRFADTCNSVCRCFANGDEKSSRSAAWWSTAPNNATSHCDCTLVFRAALLRDLVGNPFNRIVLPKKQRLVDAGPFLVDDFIIDTGFGGMYCPWTTTKVLAIAQAAYDHCDQNYALDNDRLLVLADALQDVGCDDERVLGHLRSPSRHYCGCHVIELLRQASKG